MNTTSSQSLSDGWKFVAATGRFFYLKEDSKRLVVGEDPGFVDPDNGDYRLKEDAPGRATGFEEIPLNQIGLVKDEYREI
jgi:hypothetical protein